MLILALDTSGKQASCALVRDGQALAVETRNALRGHSRALLDLCARLLASAGAGVGDVDLFAAVTGPGSFTGVRIGVAAVKGFGWTQGRPCAGVSSLAAMAHGAAGDGFLCCRVSAREDEFYHAFFERRGAEVLRLCADSAAPARDIAAQAGQYPGCRTLTDGQNALGAALAAGQMARLGQTTDCHGLTPHYIKKPQAERQREAMLENQAGPGPSGRTDTPQGGMQP